MRRSAVRTFAVFWLMGTCMIGIRLMYSNSPMENSEGFSKIPNMREAKSPDSPSIPSSSSFRNTNQTSGQVDPSRLSLSPRASSRHPARTPPKVFRPTRTSSGWSEYKKFRNVGSGRIWPTVGETEDRILNQLHLGNTNPTGKKLKKILLYNGFDGGMKSGQSRFIDHKCPVNQCTLTDQVSEGNTADAVLFMDFVLRPRFERHPNQIWIQYLLESAINQYQLKGLQDKINWTATYRTDSTLVTPYERFTFFSNYSSLPEVLPQKNYATGKTKKVAWLVSNCNAANGRHNYVEELRKYIDVDIYGACGNLTCQRGSKECNDLLRQYKFYLAFENSNCIDYITEKMYWNAFGRDVTDANDVVPIVMGARPEDYKRLAPPRSYIHVDDFESPKDLADYLHLIDGNDNVYNSFFRWKGTGEFIDTKFWCRLCAMIHEAQNTQHHVVFNNFNDWWRGEGVCVYPPNASGWASWRNVEKRFDSNSKYFSSWQEQTSND